ncbi:MAG: efflux RND transporter permease subunit [Parvibaculaceae bacterium]
MSSDLTSDPFEEPHREHKGIIAWFVNNHVAANLLMLFFLGSGLFAVSSMRAEVFPQVDLRTITVSVAYPGATPYEVEDGITRRVEEAITGIEGIDRVRSTAAEGAGTITAELEDFADADQVLDDIKDEVDRLADFPPEDAEEPSIAKSSMTSGVMTLVVYGAGDEKAIRENAERIRDDLLQISGISLVSLSGVRDYEISVEVSEDTLRRYGLTLREVSTAISNASLDLPAGSVKTDAGEILLRTAARRNTGKEFEDIVIRSNIDGSLLRLGEIATVRDGFVEDELVNRFNGEPAANIDISRTGEQDALEIEEKILAYMETLSLPSGLKLEISNSQTDILRDRISLLLRNAILGFALVFLSLVLFLDLKLAFWTSMGIPISFMGGLMIASMFGITISMVSLFALIVVLGIVVDDAIVAGENIFAAQEAGIEDKQASLQGVLGVAAPVTVGVFTTVAAFAPLLFSTGTLGQIMAPVPIIVIGVLLVSLFEAFFILPTHLSSSRRWSSGVLSRTQDRVSAGLYSFTQNILAPFVARCVTFKYATLACGIALLIIAYGLLSGGYVRFVFFPQTEGDRLSASLTMPKGTPFEVTEAATRKIVDAAERLRLQVDAMTPEDAPSIFTRSSISIGQQASLGGGPRGGNRSNGSHLARVNLELVSGDDRPLSARELERRWLAEIGEIPGAEYLGIDSSLFAGDAAVDIQLNHSDETVVQAATERLKRELANIAGVSEIKDNLDVGKRQLDFDLTPAGFAAGLTTNDLARQVRQSFYGEEVERLQRGRDEVKVLVKYPFDERRSLSQIYDMRIRLADGSEAPLLTMATLTESRAYSSIQRVDGRRIASVTAEVDGAVTTPNDVNAFIRGNVMPRLLRDFPGLSYSEEGDARNQSEDLASLGRNLLIALFIIFIMLAVQLKSYIQPLVILTAVPFGFLGAIIGHLIMGYDLSFISIFGMVALSGVVVNDSIVLVDYYNRLVDSGIERSQAVVDAAVRRFRPILLTTMTTSLGLLPMLLETSRQAQFLIPMAISLAFGIVIATVNILIMVPALTMIVESWRSRGTV